MATVYKSLSKPTAAKDDSPNPIPRRTKQRVLILSSRGVTYRHRHLLNDLYSLLPHSRKDAKLDTKTKLYQLNELAELYNCNNVMFFEARKGKDLYIWISKAPNGPTVKMHLQNRKLVTLCFKITSSPLFSPSQRPPQTLKLKTLLHQYIQCPNSTSQETACAAPDPSSPSTTPSPQRPTYCSSKNSSHTPSPCRGTREK